MVIIVHHFFSYVNLFLGLEIFLWLQSNINLAVLDYSQKDNISNHHCLLQASAQRRTSPSMRVKTSVGAIFGEIVVSHLEGLYRAEALMVISCDVYYNLWVLLRCWVLSRFWLLNVCFKHQGQTQSRVDTCHPFTKRTLALVVIEDIRVPPWNQQHQVRINFRDFCSLYLICQARTSFCPFYIFRCVIITCLFLF